MLNRHRWSALALTAALAAWAPMSHAADVGVSISIGQPGLQGRIDIGRFYEPALIAPQPVIVQAAPVWTPVQPIYLWAPPAHRAHWARYCGQYGACGAPVYFVRDDWYQAHVVPVVVRRAPPPPPVVYAPVPVYRGGPGPGYGYGPGYGRGWDDDRHHGHDHDRDGDRGGRW